MPIKYLNTFPSAGGRAAYYRRPGVRIRLRHEDGHPIDADTEIAALAAAWQREHDAYEAVQQRHRAKREGQGVRPRSIAALIREYRLSPEWTEKAAETRRDYEKALVPLERDAGGLPVIGLRRHNVTAIRNRYATRILTDKAGRPVLDAAGRQQQVPNARQANRVVTVLSILLTHAVDLGWRADNPALRPKRLRAKGDSYDPWTVEQFQQFVERATPEWRFAALLALTTGQRGQDQVKMAWPDYDGQAVYVVQLKGRKLIRLWVPVHQALKPELDARRRALGDGDVTALTILARPDGRPWPVNAFQKAAGQAIRAAGLTGVVWHGLRSTALSWGAEGGATEKMLMGLAGHTTSKTANHYTRKAEQRRLAAGAVAAIVVPLERQGNGD